MAAPIAVIGAGVVGLACAWELRQAGVEVFVVDEGAVGGGASFGNAGWICPSLSSPLASPAALKEGLDQMLRGGDTFVLRPQVQWTFLRWMWQFLRSCTTKQFEAGTAALMELNRHTMELFDRYRSEGVEFEMHNTGIVFAALSDAGLKPYARLFTLLQDLGYWSQIDQLTGDLSRLEPALNSEHVRSAMHAASDRIVRPETLTRGLADALRRAGVEIHERFSVRRLTRRPGKWLLAGNEMELECSQAVVTAGLAAAPLLRDHGLRLSMIGAAGYSVMVTDAGEPPRHALYLTEAKLALSPFNGGVRIAGVFELGARKAPAQADGFMLARRATPYLDEGWAPMTGSLSHSWAGLRPATPTGLPVIGAIPGADGLFVAAGHTMLGVTLAPATAQLLSRLVLSGERATELIPFEPRSRG